MKILIIDDSPTDTEAASSVLKEAGFDVVSVLSSSAADSFLKNELPDLILMDVNMPGTSGFQLTKRYTQSESTKSVPIIILSGKAAEVDVMWGLKNGAKEYCIKPVDGKELISKINSVLRQRKS